jgi:hypothetical protein
MTEIQSRAPAHQSRPCPCCGNDPCDLVLDLDAHKGWAVPGMTHLNPERRELLVELIHEAIGIGEAGAAIEPETPAGGSRPSATLPRWRKHLEAGGFPDVTAPLLRDLVVELDTAICTCDLPPTDRELMGAVSLGLLMTVSDIMAAVAYRFEANGAASRAGAAIAARTGDENAELDPSDDGGFIYTARLTYDSLEKSSAPFDFGAVDISPEQMETLLHAPGQAMFEVLTHDSSVVDAVDWANQLARTEYGDTRKGEDWVLTYRMRPSDSPVELREAAQTAITALKLPRNADSQPREPHEAHGEVVDEESRRRLNALRRQYP